MHTSKPLKNPLSCLMALALTFGAGSAQATVNIEYLIVGGGGGGGARTWADFGTASKTSAGSGGGGGAGGVLFGSFAGNAGSYSVTVGAAGAGGVWADQADRTAGTGGDGGDSTVFGFTAFGGGGGAAGGGSTDLALLPGRAGGSGGGGATTSGPASVGGAGTVGQGFGGGDGEGANGSQSSARRGGGGGGAGGAGISGQDGPGNGGAGITTTITGISLELAGGGGGGARSGSAGAGGFGGGGAGGSNGSGRNATSFGSGGGGAGITTGNSSGASNHGGNGSSGLVVLRYPGEVIFLFDSGGNPAGLHSSFVDHGTTYQVHEFRDAGTSSFTVFSNTAPTISDIADVSIPANSNTGPLEFTVGDAETDPGLLTLTGSSSNLTLVPDGNIVFGGSGADRTVTVTPVSGLTGSATITVTVSDGALSTNDTFVLTVTGSNTAPTISNIADQAVPSGGSIGPLNFTVGDAEADPGVLTVTGSSDNPTLVPNENIVFGGSGANRTVTVTSAPNLSGSVTITVSVYDGSLSADESFVLTVTPNNAPIVALTHPEDGAVFSTPVNLTLAATATDSDGTVTKVKFLEGETELGESAAAPFSLEWSTSTPGTYTFTAVAFDNDGASSISVPATITVVPPATIVAGPWSGNITSTSATVNVTVSAAGQPIRVRASTSEDLSNPIFSEAVISEEASGNSVRLDISGLIPLTTYHYAIDVGGNPVTSGDLQGKFTTHPAPGPASFKFSFGSCGDYRTGTTQGQRQFVYESIVNENPLFFIHMGDMNYDDVNSTNVANYRNTYTNQITQGQLRRICRAMGMSYMWDDHDYAGNDSHKGNVGRTAVRQVYRERFPHYPLPAGGPDAAIYQSFRVGRVHFILTDLRSERDPMSNADNATKSMMGAEQKQWFKDELVAARDSETPLIVWLSSVPFISTSTSGDDWGRYQTERREILEFIRDERIQNICIIAGDMHALALDDGTGTDNYVSGVRIPVFHAAALTRNGSTKGGPYTVDGATVTPNPGPGRYGNLYIDDTGTSVTATYEGRIATGSGSTLTGVSTWRSYVYETEPIRPRAAQAQSAMPVQDAVLVSWVDDSTVESGFRIERRLTGSTEWAAVGEVAANVTEFEDDTVAEGVSYEYRIIALNSTIEADPSDISAVTSYTAFQNWKLRNTGDANAPDDGDADGDGYTNLQEFLFGMDGTVPDRYPFEIEKDEDSGNITLSFPTLEGRTYQVHFSATLDNWQPASNPIAGDGTVKSWTDDGTELTPGASGNAARRFYRVQVSLDASDTP